MTVSIIHNRKNLSVTVLADANATLTIAGNSSVSNVAHASETLTGASIKQIWFGSPSGDSAYWVVQRGSNTIAVLDSTGWIDFAGNGNLQTKDSTASLVLTLVGSANGYIMVELQKEGVQQGNY